METCDHCGPAVKASWKAISTNINYILTLCNHHKNKLAPSFGANWTLVPLEEK